MSYSFAADGEPAQHPQVCIQTELFAGEACMPELGRLIKLRDALLVLKGPLANSPGLRSLIERRLLSNDVYERVLGKLAADRPA